MGLLLEWCKSKMTQLNAQMPMPMLSFFYLLPTMTYYSRSFFSFFFVLSNCVLIVSAMFFFYTMGRGKKGVEESDMNVFFLRKIQKSRRIWDNIYLLQLTMIFYVRFITRLQLLYCIKKINHFFKVDSQNCPTNVTKIVLDF